MVDLDKTILPIAEFKGQWDSHETPEWELFTICLFGKEAGDWIMDPPKVHKALEASGYKLTLTKIDKEHPAWSRKENSV